MSPESGIRYQRKQRGLLMPSETLVDYEKKLPVHIVQDYKNCASRIPHGSNICLHCFLILIFLTQLGRKSRSKFLRY